MDNGTILISILQLNVAMGILYAALPKFRFREDLYNNVVKLINLRKFFKNTDPEDADSLAGRNDYYGKPYRYIRRVSQGLPPDYQGKLEGFENFPKYTPSKLSILLWSLWHIWYEKNIDKFFVWLLSIITPFLILWAYYLSIVPFDFCNRSDMPAVLAISGQATLIVNVSWGFLIVMRVPKKIEQSLGKCSIVLFGEKIEAAVEVDKPVAP